MIFPVSILDYYRETKVKRKVHNVSIESFNSTRFIFGSYFIEASAMPCALLSNDSRDSPVVHINYSL